MSQLIDQYTAAAERGFQQGMRDALASAVAKSITSTIQRVRFQAFLDADETVIGAFDAETRPPLIVRVLPIVPDLFFRAKKYCLVATPQRLLVVAMTNPLNKFKSPSPKSMHLAVPWADVAAIEPRRHLLTSSVSVRTRTGDVHRFSSMLRGDAERLAAAAQQAAMPADDAA